MRVFQFFFIKFTKVKEYAQDLINGNLYFSPIQNFTDIEMDSLVLIMKEK